MKRLELAETEEEKEFWKSRVNRKLSKPKYAKVREEMKKPKPKPKEVKENGKKPKG